MAEQVERGGPPVTPPRRGPGRPGTVTAAIVVWTVLGVLLVLVGLALGVGSLLPGALDPGASAALPVLWAVLLVAGGVVVLLAARALVRRARRARTTLTALGSVLAVLGLVQVTFTGVGGSWFVAFVVGVALLHVPTARAWFAEEPAAESPEGNGG